VPPPLAPNPGDATALNKITLITDRQKQDLIN